MVPSSSGSERLYGKISETVLKASFLGCGCLAVRAQLLTDMDGSNSISFGKLPRKQLSAAEQFGFSGLKLVFRERSRLLELRKLL